jgi:hypothetical protein
MSVPAADTAWAAAKKDSPRREPFSDDELKELRVFYSPRHRAVSSNEAVVIWTLLDMIEGQKGWTV